MRACCLHGELDRNSRRPGADRREGCSSPAFLDDHEAEDVHHFVEKQLVALIGDTGLQAAQRPQPQRADRHRPASLRARRHRPVARTICGDWLAALLDRAGTGGEMRPCRPTRICSAPSRCWSRTGCWLMSKCSLRDARPPGRLPQAAESVSAGLGRGRRRHAAARSSTRWPQDLGFDASHRQQHRRHQRSRLRARIRQRAFACWPCT